jgi:hypothetical protein
MRSVAAAIAVTGSALVAGCGAQTAAQAPAPPGRLAAAAPTKVDQLTAVAQRRYRTERAGHVVRLWARRFAADPELVRALRSGNAAGLTAAVRRLQATPHAHISRLRVVRGSQVLADAGVPFCVAPASHTVRDAAGHAIGQVEVSIQDVIGFVRLMHRNYPVDVVVRGRGPAHVRSSLAAATHAQLPARGTVRLAGKRYAVRSFGQRALGNEPVRVWILVRS